MNKSTQPKESNYREVMENSWFSSLALFILLLNCVTHATILNYDTDKHALISFKNSLVPDPDSRLSKNWSDNTSLCNWIGVSCGIKHGRVTALNLSGYDLAGTLPPHLGNLTFLRYLDLSFNSFTGLLPPQLANLHRLKVMNVAVNSFTGQIPAWLGSLLPQLEQLILYNNSFSGGIPPSLFKKSKLKVLSMSFNLIVGDIPEEIGSSSSLETLYLNYNQLNGSIPRGIFNVSSMRHISLMSNSLTGWLPSDMCNNISNLETLNLAGNQLYGEIPTNIGKCTHLELLGLSVNHFSGNIPTEIGSLSNLRKLYLGVNDFQGILPTQLGNLSHLEKFSVTGAALTGKIPPNLWKCKHLDMLDISYNNLNGSIPREIGNLSMLTELHLGFNDLTGELPQEIGTLPFLQILDVYNNSFVGSIPSLIFNISSLNILSLSFNQFSGSLPSDLGNSLLNLEWLLLSCNRLNGPIPTSITNASKLTKLAINQNSFSGYIANFGDLRLLQELYIWGNNLSVEESPTQELRFLSSLTNCRFLEYLAIAFNPLNGILPASIGNFSTSLNYFWATSNNIWGGVPSGIGNLSNLLYLYLDGNQVTGPIPPTIGKMKQLQRMNLSYNQLEGSIPNDLCQLSHLGELGLQSNMLVGPIPECLGEIKSLREIYIASNQLNSTIPHKIWTLIDLVVLNLSSNKFHGQLPSQLGNLKEINSLDLSFNQFSGDIPSTIDGCQSLEVLNLSNNKFRGSIPQSFGNIKGLRALDLSNNSLSGMLPKSLANLQSLWYFNVSYNKLEGEIPNEGCFVNFTAQSFAHNFALCGPTRFQVSSCSKNHGESRVKRFVQLLKYILPAMILVLTVAIIAIMLTRKNNQRKLAHSTSISSEWRRISYIELERGTSYFCENNLLGRGGFSSVFRATLYDGLNVAVKVFSLEFERAAQSFDTESKLLSTIRHRNILHVIGCCSNIEFKALILEYMPNGSLDKWLHFDNYCLDLVQRVKIAIDIALALEYLHHGCIFPIVHCDVKPSNVLLDEEMTARVGDFGIAKLFDKGEDLVLTKTLATVGYAAPEYGSEGKISTQGDVYSYGIMLLEIFTRKKPTDEMFKGEMSLKEWVNEALQNNALHEVIDPHLLARQDQHFSASEQCVSSIFNLAMRCVAISPMGRINMVEVVATLKKIKVTFEANTTKRQHQRYPISNTE